MKKNPKIVAFLDVDDVLVDFSGPFNAKYGLGWDYRPDARGYGEHNIGIPMEQALATLPGEFISTQPPFEGAAALTRFLKRSGIPVILLTAIPARDAPERLTNLINNRFHFDQIFFTKGRRKHEFANALLRKISPSGQTCSIFVDDMAPAVFEFVKHVPHSFGVTLWIPFNSDSFHNEENVKLVNDGIVSICGSPVEMIRKFKSLCETKGR